MFCGGPPSFDSPFTWDQADAKPPRRSTETRWTGTEVGHRSSSVAQLGYIACQVGRKLKWDPAAERFVGDDEANRLLCLPPGRAPWNVT